MAELEIDSLTKVFSDDSGDITAVDDLSITLRDEEFLVLVGPSGCGKSTTLRMVSGLEIPTSGDVRIEGQSVVDQEPRDRDIAMVFQNYALYPHMTARENMSFGLKMSTDLDEDEIDERVNDAAQMMGITDLLEDEPAELSGGQQQRVALGRAIVRDPAAFLMDEPLSNLDAKLRSQMRTELKSLQEDLGVTTIYVTHNQIEAMTMGDRIAILNDGELQQIGTPLECYHRPNNQFVAGFIGEPSMNFLEVAVEDGTLVHDAFEYELSAETARKVTSKDRLILGVRPEDITVKRGEDNGVPATVDVVEPLGDLSHVTVELAGDQYTATIDGSRQFGRGDDLSLQFPEDRLNLFDAKTGEALRNSKATIEEEDAAIPA
ncbi:ABC transporter ATP-binding protein [Halorhabdus sp. CBA1104]|uniref:ABC transporter ATP-binding protein n=1 Tax=unclassified Halorhabdus TaxID=2621901 RepID=UPI0012B2FC81|nr:MULTISPECIES: ABC transporter ATP-binding protein [unclassified Halorhabdus]QGN07026.1 ABC transporter ATP-binding protein [Halorhabdus sp. CBA1104]